MRRVVMAAVVNVSAPLRLIVITAPGADVLPWDESQCTAEGPHTHSGKAGCKVQTGARDAWEEAAPANWCRMRQAVSQRMRRKGFKPSMVSWVDEDQGREVFHRNLLVEDTAAGRAYHAAIVLLAPRYGFGFVSKKHRRQEGLRAVNYLCGYLLSGVSGKRTRGTDLTAAARRARRYSRKWVVAPRLTRETGCTRRSLRLGRQVWAAKQGFCPMPTHGLAVIDWRVIDCETGHIRNRVFPEDDPEAARLAAEGAL